jgi:outer membrane protein assembly factor BamB
MKSTLRFLFPLFIFHFSFFSARAEGRDWIHWRGPEENGVSRETGLPGSFDPKLGPKGNVAWHQPYGGRSAPLVMDGKLYIIQGTGEGVTEGEQIVCFDEKTGKMQWTYRVNVFHTDIVSSRLGWTTLTADPANKYVYAHTTGGYLLCLDAAGKLIWSHNLTEEYGRITGYGGRVASPIFDSGLVIIGMPNGSWGDQGPARNRFLACDGKTGQVVWWFDTRNALKGTYSSTPVVTVINGQRLLISGGADGYLHAIKVRTGEQVWSYRFSGGIVNTSPVVDGNYVYCSHGEGNPEGGSLGRVICVDAGQVDPKTKTPKLVWEQKNLERRFGLSSGAVAEGLFYMPDDQGSLYCFDGKTGKVLWHYKYGKEVRGAPLIADGKIYIFDVQGRLLILTLDKDRTKIPDADDTFEYKFKDPKGFLVETNGTPIAVNGRVYFTTRTDLYCLADTKSKGECGKYKDLAEEAKFDPKAKPAGMRLFPADVSMKPGEKLKFTEVFYDENGRVLTTPEVGGSWGFPIPPIPKGATQGPRPLDAEFEDKFDPTAGTDGKPRSATVTVNAKKPGQQGYVEGTVDMPKMVARARIRVVPQIPYKVDFEAIPEGGFPGGWVNTQGKYFVKPLPDGGKALFKVNNNSVPGIAKANAYITMPDTTDYTIQADLMGTQVRDKLADLGIGNCRYTFLLDGKTNPETGKREVRVTSWEARAGGRINQAVEFDWAPSTWYTLRLTVNQEEKAAMVRAKVWKKGEKEPERWMIEIADPAPNRSGAATLYGYVSNVGDNGQPGAECYYDNVAITPNKK